MYKFVSSLIVIAIMCSSLALSAHEPVPPPPDPETLSSAKDLVALMPVETTLGGREVMNSIKRDVGKNALAWMSLQPVPNRDRTLERLFELKVGEAVEAGFTTAVSEAAPLLAEQYARRMSKNEIEAAIEFLGTEPGLKFLEVQLRNDALAYRLVTDQIYRQLQLSQMLLSAQESRKLLGHRQDEP